MQEVSSAANSECVNLMMAQKVEIFSTHYIFKEVVVMEINTIKQISSVA
jgi:hypothetical protein